MLKINLGCGWRDFGEDWVHIDGGDYDHIESKDICNLPYEDDSVDLIYASHVIEYFDRDEVQVLLNNWQSKLKKGGILSTRFFLDERTVSRRSVQFGFVLGSIVR